MMIIVQAVEDYRALKRHGMIRNGRPNYQAICRCLKMPRNIEPDSVENLCAFFWDGRMARLIEFAGVNVKPTPIYQNIEPRLWPSLISQHQMASATSR